MKRTGIVRLGALFSLLLILAVLGLAQQPKQDQPFQTAKVRATAKGFEPSTISLRPNIPARITFLRQTKDSCATSVILPDLKIEKELPLDQPVVIELTPKKGGEIAFACGMKMYRGKIVVQEQ